MKHLLIIFNLLLTSISASDTIDYNDLVYRDGLNYKKFSNEPYTGKVTGIMQGKMKKGKEVGEWLEYHSNGRLKSKSNYKNGKLHGKYISYWENGMLRNKGEYRNDLYYKCWERYFDNGSLWRKNCYDKNGNRK